MIRFLIAVVLLSTATSLSAAEVFRWVDDDGHTHYSNVARHENAVNTGLHSEDTDPAMVAARLEARRERIEILDEAGARNDQATQRDADWREEQERRCKQARDWLQKVQNQPRIYETAADGSRRIFGTDERADVVRDAREMADRECSLL